MIGKTLKEIVALNRDSKYTVIKGKSCFSNLNSFFCSQTIKSEVTNN